MKPCIKFKHQPLVMGTSYRIEPTCSERECHDPLSPSYGNVN